MYGQPLSAGSLSVTGAQLTVRTHGWGGNPPNSDDEAIARILDTTRLCIDRMGALASISDVAEALHVTRQTVYRYFSSTENLLRAAALQVVDDFMDSLAQHVAPVGDPGAAVVELVATALERLPEDPYLGLLFSSSRVGAFARGITSPAGMALGRSMFDRLTVDWAALGFTDQLLDEFVEQVLRTMQSLLLDPGDTPRSGRALRSHLDRWLWSPAMTAAQQHGVGGQQKPPGP